MTPDLAQQVTARDAARAEIAAMLDLHTRWLAAPDDETRDAIDDEAREAPLGLSVRSDWVEPGQPMTAGEYRIELATGGPAARLRGDLDEHGEPCSWVVEGQDWGTPWLDVEPGSGAESAAVGWFAALFFWGES